MARSANPAPPPDPAAIYAGLRKAVAGQRPLTGDGDEPLFPKGAPGKKLADAAVAQGLLETIKVTVKVEGKNKKVDFGKLTEKGMNQLLAHDDPKPILEALLPAVKALALAKPVGPSHDAFRHELGEATGVCVRAIGDAFEKLQKSVEAAFAKLEQNVLQSLSAPPAGPALDPAPVLAALQAALSRLPIPAAAPTARPTQPPAPQPTPTPAAPAIPTPPAPPPVPTAGVSPDQLRPVLRAAYDHLCLFAEFRDKLVEIPRLYHEARTRLPGLTVGRFHQELDALNQESKVELHKLNEVHQAKERNLAIERNDRLFYYVFWK